MQKMVASVSFGQIPSLSFKKHIFVVENISAGEAGPYSGDAGGRSLPNIFSPHLENVLEII